MKKLISGFIAFCLLCSFLIPVSATDLPTIYYNKVSGNAGDDVKVSVGIKNNTGLAGLLLRIEYNPNEVEINNITNGTAFGDAMFTTPDMTSGVNSPFVVSWVSLSGLDTDGTILNIDATLKRNITEQYPVNIISYEANDIEEKDVEVVIDNGAVPMVYFDTATGAPGDTVEIPLKIANNPGISALGIKVEYDDTVLTLSSIENSGLLSNSYFEHGNINSQPISLNWTSINNSTQDGRLAKFSFTINEETTETSTPVKVTVNESLNVDEVDVPLYGENGLLTISNATEPKEYEVVFKNWNGDELQKNNVNIGSIPIYTGTKPTKPEDANGKYVFKGWTPVLEAVTQAQVYTAQFELIEKYTITYSAGGGTINDVDYAQIYYKGEGATLPTNVTKGDSVFVGWYDNELYSGDAVTSITASDSCNKTYYAKWSQDAPSEYMIAFVNWDNTELQKSNVAVGTMPSYNGTTPTKADDEQYTYEFSGWSPVVKAVSGIATYRATYKKYLKPLTDEFSIERVDNNDGIQLIVSPLKTIVQSVNLYKAIYNGDKSLKSVEIIKCTLNEDGEIVVSLTEPVRDTNESYKIMLWDKKQVPLIAVINSNDNFFDDAAK